MDESESPTHCDECGERFMGEERAEVIHKGARHFPNQHMIIHQTCFDPEKHEQA